MTHECYAVFRGKSTFRLGKSTLDPDTNDRGEPVGRDVALERGDIIVLPVSLVGSFVVAMRAGWEVPFEGARGRGGLPVDDAIPGWCQSSLD